MADSVKTAINWLVDYQQALDEARNRNRLVYLDFWFPG